ncbi:MAG TPA: hypothetical protein VMU80_07180 [Bryobacteraceae bacterium]|nr:hypothetical protein [Bryobacteraceae bacterium]
MSGDPGHAIERARHSVRQALKQWDASDVERIEASRQQLQESVVALKTAIDLLKQGNAGAANGLQPAIRALRRDISAMIRLVDACAAIHRGLTLRLVGALPPYDAAGRTAGVPEASPEHALVG